MNLFGMLITTDALAVEGHKESLNIIHAAKISGIPVAELQHGLFTYGLSYYADIDRSFVSYDSLPARSFYDYLLSWYDTSITNSVTIGCPSYRKPSKKFNGLYTLILSNLKWEIYTVPEKFGFFYSVIKLAHDNPDDVFIWKLHPSEISFSYWKNISKDLFTIYPSATKNILFYHQSRIMQHISLYDLIKKKKKVITTLSTTILDTEMNEKDAIVYDCAAVRELTSQLHSCDTFSNAEELAACYAAAENHLESGFLVPYNPSKFEAFLDEHWQRPEDIFAPLESIYR